MPICRVIDSFKFRPHKHDELMRENNLVLPLDLSNGEIYFLWWFIQGSIMNPETRWKLRHAWGLCERHAWGALSVEASFRHNYLHGPAILYEDLISQAIRAFPKYGPCRTTRLAWNLRSKEPCLMCDCGLDDKSPGTATEDIVKRGKDTANLIEFALATERYWHDDVCGRCARQGSKRRCRPHLLEDISQGLAVNTDEQQAFLKRIQEHLSAYSQSFVCGYHGTDTKEDRAALLSAVGWCSGWTELLKILCTHAMKLSAESPKL
jgi:hypothetical protein